MAYGVDYQNEEAGCWPGYKAKSCRRCKNKVKKEPVATPTGGGPGDAAIVRLVTGMPPPPRRGLPPPRSTHARPRSMLARSDTAAEQYLNQVGRDPFSALHDLAGAQQQLPRKPQLPPAPPASKEGKAAGHAGRKLTFSESAWAITANSLGRRSADEGEPADDEVAHGEESSSAGDHQPVAASTSTYGAIPLAPARRRPIAHPVDEGPAEPLLYAHLALPADSRDDGSFAISDDAGEPIWAREQLLRGTPVLPPAPEGLGLAPAFRRVPGALECGVAEDVDGATGLADVFADAVQPFVGSTFPHELPRRVAPQPLESSLETSPPRPPWDELRPSAYDCARFPAYRIPTTRAFNATLGARETVAADPKSQHATMVVLGGR